MGKTASIFIDGEVNNWSYSASLQGVRDTLNYWGQFDDIQVTINSCGGDIAEGFAIYDLLGSYGKPITTIVIGQCCSAATIIFLAGSTRLIYENVVAFMVHQAAGGVENATAEQMRTVADFIDSFNDRMAAIYIEKTGKTAETVAEWMGKDTFMTAQEALDNGFATAIQKPVTAKLYASRPLTPSPSSTQSPNTDVMKIITDQVKRLFSSVTARMEKPVIEAKKVTTSTGEELDIAYAGESIAENDPVTKNGEPAPDGVYVIDGISVTVKGGKIEKIDTSDTSVEVTAEGETTEETTEEESTEKTADDLATLKTENETLKAEVTALKSNQSTITAQMRILLGSKISADPSVPAPKGSVKAVRVATDEQDDEDKEREDMLTKRKNRGLGITETAE